MQQPSSLSESRHIINPAVDPWIVGGLSILVLGSFMLLSSYIPQQLVLGNFIVLTIVLNGTHFLASYRLLYASKEKALKYPMASVTVPTALIAFSAYAVWAAGNGFRMPLEGLVMLATLYLALHYTGQAWGMMASYAFLGEVKFASEERTAFRLFLRILAVWHVCWALKLLHPEFTVFGNPPYTIKVDPSRLMNILHCAAIITLIGGAAVFFRMSRRLNRRIPISVILPYFSLHVWYLFLWIYPQSIFWVQLAHALQYLAFPVRVELNRAALENEAARNAGLRRHLLQYLGVLTLASFLIFYCLDGVLNYFEGGFATVWIVLAASINIHHYFIDGCIWHISNPVVSKELFAHVPKPSSADPRGAKQLQ